MKSEQELLWLVDTRILNPSDLRELFAGKKLVDAEAVVLSVEDASAILWNLKNDRWDTKSMCALDNAIEQARGKNGN